MTTVLALTDAPGVSYALPSQAALDYDHRRYHVFARQGPVPPQGAPCLFKCLLSGFQTGHPSGVIAETSGVVDHERLLIRKGWRVVHVGVTGYNDPGIPTQGYWQSPYTGAQTAWKDADRYSGLSDAWRALVHLCANAWKYGIDINNIVTTGRSGEAHAAHFLCHAMPSDLAYSSGDEITSWQEYTVRGAIMRQYGNMWWRALDQFTGNAAYAQFTQTGDNDIPGVTATSSANASQTQMEQGSGWQFAFSSAARRAHVASRPVWLWNGNNPSTGPDSFGTAYNTTAGSPPSATNFNQPTINKSVQGVHDTWSGNMLLKYLYAVDAEQGSTTHADQSQFIAGPAVAEQEGAEVTSVVNGDNVYAREYLLNWIRDLMSVEPTAGTTPPHAPRKMCTVYAPTYALSQTGVPTQMHRNTGQERFPRVQIQFDDWSDISGGTLQLLGWYANDLPFTITPVVLWDSSVSAPVANDSIILNSTTAPGIQHVRAIALRVIRIISGTRQEITAYVME